ncbi:DUF1993 domain-containing protein [Simiduia sp. 21SJ11W-1]|uniref:DUF1993 family protein n=1 Tax=Simiduia sp. 21SJ11W-1 TaxID=2909669 RepID=UPI0020A07B70|nr:DUF1993 family protein [Simiduia sp. 21SJ11W-1]UTA47221.1 DUF1993 domain-containing protein [Simiduia sp. 21SJ11W-1]
MSTPIKQLFLDYLAQLSVVVGKVPDALFSDTLHEGMFSLEMNVQIAANFLLRGYCPLIGRAVVLHELSSPGKPASLQLIQDVAAELGALPEVQNLDDSQKITDTAGFAEISLGQSGYLMKYIIPNYMFHVSMVYAIARKNGVPLSKGDFDGLHAYPPGFSFLN